jgi:hypothetical protein
MANMSYSINGLGFAHSSPQAMFMPVIRAYPPPYGRQARSGSDLGYLHASPFIEHIDMTTVWKGLLLPDAERLLYLHLTFKDSLEDLLADALHQVHEEFQQQYSSRHNLCVGNQVKSSFSRRLPFSLSQLVQSMQQRLKLCGKWVEKSQMRDFMMLFPVYLFACDCLMDVEGDRVGDTAVEICLYYYHPSMHSVPHGPLNEAAWIPDMLSFDEINDIQREGQELIIIPHYRGNRAFTSHITNASVHYSVESSQPWLSWDKSISGFRGNVPLYSEMGGSKNVPAKVYGACQAGPYAIINALRVEIKALLIAGSGFPVRLERTIRARLTFKIVPWYAHDSACAPKDDSVRPFAFHDPEYSSPSISSRSSSLGTELAYGSSRSSIACKDGYPYLSPKSSRVSAELLPMTPDRGSPPTSPRKRRATSSLKILSPTKRQRENGRKQDLSNLDTKDSSKSNVQGDLDQCWTNSTTLDERISSPIRSPHHNHLSHMHGDLALGSGDEDEVPGLDHSGGNLVDKVLFHGKLSPSSAKDANLNSIYGIHKMTEDEASSSQESESFSEQRIHPTTNSFDGLTTNEIPRSKLAIRGVCQGQSISPSDTQSSISTRSESSDGSPSGRSRKDSSTPEIIIENSKVDPGIRHEQAVLWRILNTKESQRKKNMGRISVHELKDMYAAMKLSAVEVQERDRAKIGLGDVFDDIFMAGGSSTDEMEDAFSQQGSLEASESQPEYNNGELVAHVTPERFTEDKAMVG